MSIKDLKSEEKVKVLSEWFDESYKAIKPLHDKWLRWYKKYHGQLEVIKEGRSNLFINYTLPTVDALVARVIQTIFNQKPYVSIVAKTSDKIENAKNMEQLIEFQLENRIGIVKKFYNLIRDSFLYGISVAYKDWGYETKKVKVKQPKTMLGIKIGEEIVEQEVPTYNAPRLTIYDIFNYFWDTKGESVEEHRFDIFRSYISMDELKKKAKQGYYTNIDAVEENYSDDTQNIKQLKQEARGIKIDSSAQLHDKKLVELLFFVLDDQLITLANRKHIIREKENPNLDRSKNIFPVVWHPLTNEFVGKSMVEIMESLQDELNAKRNQRVDNINLIINKVFKVLRGSDVDPNQLLLKPGGVIEVTDMDNIRELEMTDNTGGLITEDQMLKGDIQYITGVDYTQRGIQGAKTETATENVNRQNNAGYIFNIIINIIVTDVLIPMYRAMIKLNQQFLEEETIRVDSPDGMRYVTITPEMIDGEFDLEPANPNFELPLSKENKRKDMVEMFNILTQNPAAVQHINVQEFIKKLFEAYDIKDIDRLLLQMPQGIMPFNGVQPNLPIENMPMEGQMNG